MLKETGLSFDPNKELIIFPVINIKYKVWRFNVRRLEVLGSTSDGGMAGLNGSKEKELKSKS